MSDPTGDLTVILQRASGGDRDARSDLVARAYDDLRQLAGARMAGERMDHTLSPTALVNEVSLKLLDESGLRAGNRKEFFSYVVKGMRNLLIDHARSKAAKKRGGGAKVCSFDEAVVAADAQSEQFLELNEALTRLAEIEPRKAQVVELRYFGGFGIEEIAEQLETSPATVKRDWTVARAWLAAELGAVS